MKLGLVPAHYKLHTKHSQNATPKMLPPNAGSSVVHWDVLVGAAAPGLGGATRGGCVTLTALVTSISGKALSPA